MESLSARRAWIEIHRTGQRSPAVKPSLSARRAWIEILVPPRYFVGVLVALRKESVDRNSPARPKQANMSSRSPQGERG